MKKNKQQNNKMGFIEKSLKSAQRFSLFAFLVTTLSCIFTIDIKAQIINTVAGSGAFGYSTGGGVATAADLRWPRGVRVISAGGDFYFADEGNHIIRKVTSAGAISDIAGIATSAGYSGDGGPATAAQLNSCTDVAVDNAGNIYIADRINQCIRKVDPSGIISTFAGIGGAPGYSGDGGPATSANLFIPIGVAVDASGNVYIADFGNSRIRVVNGAGIINTYAGNGTAGYAGDGGAATAAELNNPAGLRFDGAGNLFIADATNNVIRKVVTSTGIISTYAGNNGAGAGFSGDGGPATSAQLNNPYDVAADASGNIFIADFLNNRIRIVDAGGTINTYAGNGAGGYGGDGGPATSASLYGPIGVAVNTATGDVYIGDQNNYRIRMVTGSTPPPPSGCSDTCYWKVTGNNIIGGNNTFGTLTKDDINIVTNNTPIGIYTLDGLYGLYGWNAPSAPTAYLDVECLNHNPDGSGTSDVRFRNLEKGSGDMVVIDPATGYVFDSHISTNDIPTNTCHSLFYVPKLTAASGVLGCSQIYDDGTSVGINSTGPFGYIYPGGSTWYTGTLAPPAAGNIQLDVNGVTSSLAYIATSDERYKTNISSIQDPFKLINALHGKTYYWNELARQKEHADGSKQYGFIAQEVAKVFPEAAVQDQDGNYGLFYNAFIPVLTEGAKELYTLYQEEKAFSDKLQSQLDELRTKIDALENCCTSNSSSTTGINSPGSNKSSDRNILYQNTPNPFSTETEIRYFIARMNSSASIMVSDMNGREVTRYPINTAGNGSITVKVLNMMPGIYLYSLIIDGAVTETMKMIVGG